MDKEESFSVLKNRILYDKEKRKHSDLPVKALGYLLNSIKEDAPQKEMELRRKIMVLLEKLIISDEEPVRASAVEFLFKNGGELTRKNIERIVESDPGRMVKAAMEKARKKK